MKLLFKQRLFSWFDSYDIYDEAGETVFTVKGRLSWGHCLEIYDRFGDAWEVRTAELHLLGEKPEWMYRCGHAGTDDYCALWSFEILTREEAQAALRREQDD